MRRLRKTKKSIILLRYGYILAIVLVAMLGWHNYHVATLVIAQNSSYAEEINVAGRQRMLSQRIARYSQNLLFRESDYYAYELQKAISLMGASNHKLVDRDADLPLNLRALYLRNENGLDRRVKHYLANAALILNNANYWKDIPLEVKQALHDHLIADQESTLLPMLDRAVQLYEDNANQQIEQVKQQEKIALLSLIVVLLLEAIFIFRPLIKTATRHVDRVERMAMHDSLTGLLNRGAFWFRAEEELSRAARHKRDSSLLLIDLDHFKKINDTFGHKVGDQVLILFSQQLTEHLRHEDLFARIGGEEFALLLTETSLPAARIVAEKLLSVVQESQLELVNEGLPNKTVRFSCSIGIAFQEHNDRNLDDLYTRADKALYCSKEAGRNRVTYETECEVRHVKVA